MAWFLALQGTPNSIGQSLNYELQGSAEPERLAEEMSAAVVVDRVVAVPAMLEHFRKPVTLYVRPAAWGVWSFYEMSEQERQEMRAANPLINALAQAARQQQAKRPQGGSALGVKLDGAP